MPRITVVDVRAVSSIDYRLLIAVDGSEQTFYARRVGIVGDAPGVGTFEPPSFADIPMDAHQFRQLMSTIFAVHSGDPLQFPIVLENAV